MHGGGAVVIVRTGSEVRGAALGIAVLFHVRGQRS